MVDFIVTAVEERKPFVEYLQHHIPNLNVVCDKKKDPMETFMRAWGTYPDNPSVRMQDDIILTKDFIIKVQEVISKYPDDVIQFFSMRQSDADKGTSWVSGGNWIGNLCHYLPKGMSGEIFDYGLTWKRIEEHPTADDLLMRDYFVENKVKYLCHIPSLVEHAEVYSVIDRKRSKFRKTKTFVEPDYDSFPVIKDYEV